MGYCQKKTVRTNIARKSDPVESHLAAEEITISGYRQKMACIALKLVIDNPGLTSNELEKLSGFTDGKIRKRLPELERDGLVKRGESRRSTVSNKVCCTWWPK